MKVGCNTSIYMCQVQVISNFSALSQNAYHQLITEFSNRKNETICILNTATYTTIQKYTVPILLNIVDGVIM